MPLPAHVRAECQRILDREARLLLADQLDADAITTTRATVSASAATITEPSRNQVGASPTANWGHDGFVLAPLKPNARASVRLFRA